MILVKTDTRKRSGRTPKCTGLWRRLRFRGMLELGVAVLIGTALPRRSCLADLHPAAQSGVPGQAVEHPSSGAAAAIQGFRDAHFGMDEAEVRQAIRRDFPAAAARLSHATHPRERTTVLSFMVDDLLPGAGPAQLFYILGYASRRLVQVNIIWTSDGHSSARDEGIITATNALREDLQARYRALRDKAAINQQIGENAFLVFRAAEDNHMVMLLLTGFPAKARTAHGAEAVPLTLQLSYISNYKNADVFRIAPGGF